jgi:hypothetical protein
MAFSEINIKVCANQYIDFSRLFFSIVIGISEYSASFAYFV